MIVLSNGDKWIFDDCEWEDAGISDKDAVACKIPIGSLREFVEKVTDPNGSYLPRKWIDLMGGHWDCNFDVYEEVFTYISARTITNNWSTVYIMPWGHVYVRQSVDSSGCEAVAGTTKLENAEEYKKAVLGEVEYAIGRPSK